MTTIARRHLIKQVSFGDALGEYTMGLAPCGCSSGVPMGHPAGSAPMGCLCPAVLLAHALHGHRAAPSVLSSFLQNVSTQADQNIFHFTALDLSLLAQPLFLNLICGANAPRQGRTCRSICVRQYLAQQCPEPS